MSPASFRDPAGFVFVRDGVVYRQVNPVYRSHYVELLRSGLYAELTARGWLVPHEEVDESAAVAPGSFKILRPLPIEFVSYPYEWSFSQLQDAALRTLDIQLLALDHGISLKDASAYNLQFHRGRPISIDTLSFECYPEGRPWVAYRQFCQHFLAPLALMARVDVRLSQLLRIHLDGVPLDLASRLLPPSTRLHPGLLAHLHLHARAQRWYSSDARRGSKPSMRVGRLGLVGMLQGMRRLVSRLRWNPAHTEWADYYDANNYSESAFEEKRRLVGEFLDAAAPKRAWDLGANTGVFSRLAAERGASTIAFDIDPAAVERHYRRVREEREERILPLLLDLANPSPGLGWAGVERDGLATRGPADCLLALAIVHHLAISNNLPLSRIAEYLSRLGRRLVIEFVPKADSQVQRLLSAREDIFDRYDREHFETEFSAWFRIDRAEEIRGSERWLYLMTGR